MRIAYHDVDPDLLKVPEPEIREKKKRYVLAVYTPFSVYTPCLLVA